MCPVAIASNSLSRTRRRITRGTCPHQADSSFDKLFPASDGLVTCRHCSTQITFRPVTTHAEPAVGLCQMLEPQLGTTTSCPIAAATMVLGLHVVENRSMRFPWQLLAHPCMPPTPPLELGNELVGLVVSVCPVITTPPSQMLLTHLRTRCVFVSLNFAVLVQVTSQSFRIQAQLVVACF